MTRTPVAPPGATHVAGLDPFDLLDTEAARLDRYFAGLDAAAWQRPSRCDGWSVRDVLAHLAGEELYNHACLDDDMAGFAARLRREGIDGGFNEFNEWCVRVRRDLPVTEVLTEWREGSADTRHRMRDRGVDGTLTTSVGSYPAGLQAFHYASEYATHADDVAVPVATEERAGRDRWRAAVARFALAEQEAPVAVTPVGDMYHVEVADVGAELPAADFVAASVGRLPADHPLDPRLRDALRCLA